MTNMPNLDVFDRNHILTARRRPSGAGFSSGSLDRLAVRLTHRLTRAPRISVMGEFNSGKSTLINVLIGAAVMPTSVEANTRLPIRVFHADKPSLAVETADRERFVIAAGLLDPEQLRGAAMLHAGLPLGRLEAFEVIDTPGLQAGDPDDCESMSDISRQSHLAIWCSTAMQAWKASELGAWQALPKRLKTNGILAITFKDAIRSREDEGRLWGRINAEAAPHFKKVVMISARDAIAARNICDAKQSEQMWYLSGAAELNSAVDDAVSSIILQRVRGAERLLSSAMTGAQRQMLSA